MSIKKVSKNQPDTFEFNEENLKHIKEIINRLNLTTKQQQPQ